MRGLRVTVVALIVGLVVGTATPALGRVPAPSGATVFASLEVSGLDAGDRDRVRGLWGEFVASVPAHSTCLLAAPPRIVTKHDMRPRAAYAPNSATLFVKPGDVSRLVVFHELAHHLDFTCGAADAIGDDVRRAQGIDSSKPWWLHGDPVTWPAEYFANAVAEVLGQSTAHGVRPATVEVVAQWLGVMDPEPGPPVAAPPLFVDTPTFDQVSIV